MWPGPHFTIGSSPLARGLPRALHELNSMARIIPARAGFTPATGSSPRQTADHPRSRGVYAQPAVSACATAGSSPLARGLRSWLVAHCVCAGIIPARAGFTCPHAGRRRRPADHPRSRGVYGRGGPPRPQPPQDHPRSRGVYRCPDARSTRACGSSPLARGLLGPCSDRVGVQGIIPARAGFTLLSSEFSAGFSDHPRSRGVYRS